MFIDHILLTCINKIRAQKPLNANHWDHLIRILSESNIRLRTWFDPYRLISNYKKFSMGTGRREIRLAKEWPTWDENSKISNVLHEARHCHQIERNPGGKCGFFFKYLSKDGRYNYELEAIQENLRWRCRTGQIGTTDNPAQMLTPITRQYLQRITEHFGKNYKMGKNFNKDRMYIELKKMVIQAVTDGYIR